MRRWRLELFEISGLSASDVLRCVYALACERLEEIPHLIHQAMSTVGKLAPSLDPDRSFFRLLRLRPGMARAVRRPFRGGDAGSGRGKRAGIAQASVRASRKTHRKGASVPSVTAPSKEPRSGEREFVGCQRRAAQSERGPVADPQDAEGSLLPASVLSALRRGRAPESTASERAS